MLRYKTLVAVVGGGTSIEKEVNDWLALPENKDIKVISTSTTISVINGSTNMLVCAIMYDDGRETDA